MKLTKECLTTGDGETFCSGSGEAPRRGGSQDLLYRVCFQLIHIIG